MRICFALLLISCCCAQTLPLPNHPLSADDLAALAIANNPQLQADLAAIGLAEADLKDARLLLRNPRLDVLFPLGNKPFEMIFNFPLEVFIQRPRRIAVSQAALNQISKSLMQNGVNTARDARLAHADLWQATERLKLTRESLALRERIAKLTKARFDAGDISELETMAANADAANARELEQRTLADVQLARQRLLLVLGLPVTQTSLELAPIAPPQANPTALESLFEKALASRADLRAAELAITTATQRARWERRRFLWFTAQLGAKEVSPHGVLAGPGTSFEIPVFNRNQGLIARAEAEIQANTRQYLALKQRVAFEVADARAQMEQALISYRNVQEQVLPPLERTIRLAEEQYKRGDAAFLFVLEQTRAWLDSRQRLIDAQANFLRAQAQLERSVGSK